ncbi:MAG: response regulator transcription factor [Panacagrimonas sp.]
MKDPSSIVYLVDDDQAVREALSSLIRSAGLWVESFRSATDFLQCERTEVPACLVLDVRMPGISGIDLQRKLTESADKVPIIFITGHGDIPTAVQAMRSGAFHFLAKPFTDEALLSVISQAIAKDARTRQERSENAELLRRFQSLTARELEMVPGIDKGLLNKQIAAEFGISEMTVKVHRHNIMHKMGVNSVQELVRALQRVRKADASDATV